MGHIFNLAEGGRFELPKPFGLAVFKTAGINHYPTSPSFSAFAKASTFANASADRSTDKQDIRPSPPSDLSNKVKYNKIMGLFIGLKGMIEV